MSDDTNRSTVVVNPEFAQAGEEQEQDTQSDGTDTFDHLSAYRKIAGELGSYRKKIRALEEQLQSKSETKTPSQKPEPADVGTDPRLEALLRKDALNDALDAHQLSGAQRQKIKAIANKARVPADELGDFVAELASEFSTTRQPTTRKDVATPNQVPAPAPSTSTVPDNPALWSDATVEGLSNAEIYQRWKQHRQQKLENPAWVAKQRK